MTDSASSGFFKETKTEQEQRKQRSQRNRLSIVALVGVLYAMIAAGIGYYVSMTGFSIATTIVFYAYGLIGGLAVLMLKKIYAQSEQNRRMLIEILDTSSVARLITDKEQKTIYTNNSFNTLTAKLGGASLENFIKMFDKPVKIQRQFEKMVDAASNSPITELSAKIDGQQHIFEITAQTVPGWENYIHWRIENITQQREMELSLSEKQEKLLDFTNKAPVGFFSVDENGRFLFANDTLADWLQTSQEDLKEKHTLHDFIKPDAQPALKAYQCFDNDNELQSGELTLYGQNGHEFRATVTHALERESNGEKLRTRSVVYDLTPEQEMQQALDASETRFQHLFEDAPISICLLSQEYTIDESNRAFSHLIGKSADKIKTKNLTNFIASDDHPALKEWLDGIMNEAPIPHAAIEVTLKGDNNNETVTQLYARKFKGTAHLVLHFIDLTEQKNLEQQFTQSQKMQAVGQLAGGIAHDFNNLLTAMIGFCDLLLLRHKPGNPSFSDVMQIKQNANRAANLVRQLLAFSRQQTLQPKVLDLTDVLTELSHLLRRLIGANIELKIEHDSEIGLIKADQGQMEQVLINLAVNARDAMKDGGKITIRTKNLKTLKDTRLEGEDILPAGQWVSVAVEDQGTGIDPEHLPRIFEPFFSTKEVGAGTGLGLSTVHGIVHQTGGALAVDSTLGQGTTFTIYLPRHDNEEQSNDTDSTEDTEQKQETQDLTGSAKVLLVEDEDAVRTFSARALSNKGYDTLEAANGALALELINNENPDLELLITDVVMPEMDGPTMAKEVKLKYPNIKIIFMSGYTEDKLKEEWHGEAQFLPKPFTLKQLATKVKDVMEDV